jgi:hypothetical protein
MNPLVRSLLPTDVGGFPLYWRCSDWSWYCDIGIYRIRMDHYETSPYYIHMRHEAHDDMIMVDHTVGSYVIDLDYVIRWALISMWDTEQICRLCDISAAEMRGCDPLV